MVAVRLVVPPAPAAADSEPHRRLRLAALRLAEESGFDAITADGIAGEAGISRRTFYRYFPSKEDALFSDHAGYLATMETRLEHSQESRAAAAGRALTVVLEGYLEDTNFSFRRDRLVRRTPVLQDRESLWFIEYQKVVTRFLAGELAESPASARAAILAAGMIAALRSTLDSWIEGPLKVRPRDTLAQLLNDVTESIARGPLAQNAEADRAPREVVVVTTDLSSAEIARLIEDARPGVDEERR